MRASRDVPLRRRAQPWLGTIVEIGIDRGSQKIVDEAFALVARVHRCMSFHEPHSDLARLRNAAVGEAVAVDPMTVEVLRAARSLHRSSLGLFDVAVGRTLVQRGFLPRVGIGHLGRYPGGADDIEIVDDTNVAQRRPVLIDLGGIAKGYAVDLAVQCLMGSGARCGIVNAGGDLRVFGEATQSVVLRRGSGVFTELVGVSNCAVASSENRRHRHRRRHESVTPHVGPDGRPVRIDDLICVTADSCMVADALTKVAMVDADLADRILADHHGHVIRLPTAGMH